MAGYQDDALIRDFRNGLPEAFKELYHRFYQKLYYTSVKLIDNREEAKDITIVTLNKLFEKTQDFDNLPEIAGFLFTACRNDCFDYLRYLKKVTDGKRRLLSNLQNEVESINDQLTAEYLYALKKLIENLPNRQRQAIELLFVNKLKFKEAAANMNISVAAVIKLRKNALSALRTVLHTQPTSDVLAAIMVFFIFQSKQVVGWLNHFFI
jgi:RNA polymerase sigma-70 factor (ECF subfamily)